MNLNTLFIFGIIAFVVVGSTLFFVFPNLFKAKTNYFSESKIKTTRFFNPTDTRKVDVNRYLTETDSRNSTCPDNYLMYGLNPDGSFICKPDQIGSDTDTTIFTILPADCSSNQYMYGVNSNNTLKCRQDQSTGINENINTQGSYSFDKNSFNIDINAGGNSIINALDINANTIYIQTTGDMNFFVYDKNVIIQTALGMIEINPDKNELCTGNDTKFCIWNSDGNGFIGWK